MNLHKALIANKIFGDGGSGGGGSSDFSTAEVTITTYANNFYWNLPVVESDGLVVGDHKQLTTTESNQVALYKGSVRAYIGEYDVTNITGSVTFADGLATITGDCAFTVETK